MNTKQQTEDVAFGASFPQMAGRIVVGIDGSQHSSLALRYAAQLARHAGASIEAVTALPTPSIEAPTFGGAPWSSASRAHRAQQESIVTAFGSNIPNTFVAFVRKGAPADVLVDLSKGADLLIVGRHGKGGASGVRLGSVSQACADRAHCPVLVVPERSSRKRN